MMTISWVFERTDKGEGRLGARGSYGVLISRWERVHMTQVGGFRRSCRGVQEMSQWTRQILSCLHLAINTL